MKYHFKTVQVIQTSRRSGPRADPVRYADPSWLVEAGEIVRNAATLHEEDNDFIEPGNLYREAMPATDRDHLVSNILGHTRIAQGLGLVTRTSAPFEADALH